MLLALTPVGEGSIGARQGSVCFREGSVCSREESSCFREGSLCFREGSIFPVRDKFVPLLGKNLLQVDLSFPLHEITPLPTPRLFLLCEDAAARRRHEAQRRRRRWERWCWERLEVQAWQQRLREPAAYVALPEPRDAGVAPNRRWSTSRRVTT